MNEPSRPNSNQPDPLYTERHKMLANDLIADIREHYDAINYPVEDGQAEITAFLVLGLCCGENCPGVDTGRMHELAQSIGGVAAQAFLGGHQRRMKEGDQ